MPTKRESVLDSAIEILGSRGLRALTHRAVDDDSGMPSGSTSNYFRTREALLCGVAERLEQRDYVDWEALSRIPAPTTVDQLVDGLALLVIHAVTVDRTRTLARYAMFLEAQTMPALQTSVQRGHERLTEWIASMLRTVAPGTTVAKLLVDYLDGVLLHQLTSPVPGFDPRTGLEKIVRALVS
ncbi:TetR/AcrR family transcriptional regulator [Nocardia sp. NPDC051463]|uniref:TetR/AcrR family transcriptional regulator n=1 Tax=Nocardia sp. NPDC051463 TaxID=3154845 RepID=UPI00344EF83D